MGLGLNSLNKDVFPFVGSRRHGTLCDSLRLSGKIIKLIYLLSAYTVLNCRIEKRKYSKQSDQPKSGIIRGSLEYGCPGARSTEPLV